MPSLQKENSTYPFTHSRSFGVIKLRTGVFMKKRIDIVDLLKRANEKQTDRIYKSMIDLNKILLEIFEEEDFSNHHTKIFIEVFESEGWLDPEDKSPYEILKKYNLIGRLDDEELAKKNKTNHKD